jgi:hypothetical protein
MMDPEARRRQARGTWPIARFTLGDESANDISALTTPEERVAMMWELAETAWTLAGRQLPTYDRQNIPACVFRSGEPRPSDDDA